VAISEQPAPPTPAEPWWAQAEGKASTWVSGFLARVFGKHPVAAASSQTHSKKAAASFVDTTPEHRLKADMIRTALATQEEGQHTVSLTSVWGQMEAEDRTEEDTVKSEDESERQRAKTVEVVHPPTPAEMKSRHGTDMSSFWSHLEEQDDDIVMSVTKENAGEYERLTQDQNQMMSKAASQLKETKLHMDRNVMLHGNDNAFLSKTIHDKWEDLEQKDTLNEKRIHDSPDLQMLQLDHREHALK